MAEGGERNVMLCRSHIITYYNRETIIWKGGTAVHLSLQAILFFSQPFSQVLITESHEELRGKSDGYACKKASGCSAVCPEKRLWVVCCELSPFITPFKLIRSCLGEINVPRESMNYR